MVLLTITAVLRRQGQKPLWAMQKIVGEKEKGARERAEGEGSGKRKGNVSASMTFFHSFHRALGHLTLQSQCHWDVLLTAHHD